MTWKRLLALALGTVMLSACSLSPSAHASTSIPRCATIQAQALVSPNAPVAGAFECLTADLAQANSFRSDADLQAVAAIAPVYTSYRYLGHTAQGYYFEFSAGSSVAGCFRFHIDSTGHVDKVASKQGSCPKPLP